MNDANECFEINLARPSKDGAKDPVFSESFNPAFTYPFFGEAQQIIGYKEPSIQLSFRANDMKPSLLAQFEEAVELPDEVYSDNHLKVDLGTVFQEYLPACTSHALAIATYCSTDRNRCFRPIRSPICHLTHRPYIKGVEAARQNFANLHSPWQAIRDLGDKFYRRGCEAAVGECTDTHNAFH